MIIRAQQPRRGFFIIDVATGLVLCMALAFALTIAVSSHSKTAARFADERSAVYLAERVLTELQSARPAPFAPTDAAIDVKALSPIPELPGKSWAQVKATVHGRSTTLVGWIPTPKPAP